MFGGLRRAIHRWYLRLTRGGSVFNPFRESTEFLCDRCKLNHPNTCLRSERPNARKCPDFDAR